MTLPSRQFRQGDVLIIGTPLPPDLHEIPREQERIVLAEGEATGHAHAIADAGATLYRPASDQADIDARFLQIVAEAGVELRHEEHAPITLPAGTYRVIRQREYTPQPGLRAERWRIVGD